MALSHKDRSYIPFFDGLRRYAEKGVVRFHTPGHRGGRWILDPLSKGLGTAPFDVDVSDVLEGEDASQGWTEALRLSEASTARLFGAAGSRFLVNGTSGGIHAAVMALAPGADLLFSRASHLSVYAAALLARSPVHTIVPDFDEDWDIAGPPSVRSVVEHVRSTKARLYIETYPNYYGITPPLDEIVKQMTDTLIVADEAHGSHFAFCPGAPPAALSLGVTLSVQSFHKTLGSLTQSSVLHVHARRDDLLPLIDRTLTLLQTTSPSPLLLASLEAAAQQARLTGPEDWGRAVSLTKSLRDALEAEVGCRCLTESFVRQRWNARLDPARVVVNVADIGWSGLHAAEWLRHNARIQVEMANRRSLVLLVSPGNTPADVDKLVKALKTMAQRPKRRPPDHLLPFPAVPIPRVHPWEAFALPTRSVPLGQAVGGVSAELICPYPPGIPVLIPGEEVTQEVVEYLQQVRREGWEVRGAMHPDLDRIEIVR